MTKPLAEIVREIDALYVGRDAPLPKAPRKRPQDNCDPCICGARNTWHPECYASNKDKLHVALVNAWPTIRAALENGAGWQPIETAPKDGTEFDVWCPEKGPDATGYRVADCWWSEHDQRFRTYGDGGMQWANQPTHWMPLPQPPKERV